MAPNESSVQKVTGRGGDGRFGADASAARWPEVSRTLLRRGSATGSEQVEAKRPARNVPLATWRPAADQRAVIAEVAPRQAAPELVSKSSASETCDRPARCISVQKRVVFSGLLTIPLVSLAACGPIPARAHLSPATPPNRPAVRTAVATPPVLATTTAAPTPTPTSLPSAAWHAVPAPSGPAVLRGIACPSLSECWAVGSDYDADDLAANTTLVMGLVQGVWSQVASPRIAGQLMAVSCADASDCWAVGDVAEGSLIEHWDGETWSQTLNPHGFPQSGWLEGITCLSTANCWAVGGDADADTVGALLLHFDGTSWISAPAPPVAGGGSLDAVACPLPDDCWAVGEDATGDGLVEHLADGVWRVVPSPDLSGLPGAGADNLGSVACPSPDECWAVGPNGFQASGTWEIEEMVSGSWRLLPTSQSPIGNLFGITCPQSDDCWAVGTAAGASLPSPDYAGVIHWDGSAWAMAEVPAPANAPNGDMGILTGVACPAPNACWAVGVTETAPAAIGIQESALIETTAGWAASGS